MTTIGIYGGGRMAEAVFSRASAFPEYQVSAIISRTPVTWAGTVPQYDSPDRLESGLDVLIDFSLPDGTLAAAQWCAKTGTALLSGTTGLAAEHLGAIEEAAVSTAVLSSANLSTGIALVRHLAEELSRMSGEHVDVHIEDTHHVHKKDAPSGTALMLGGAITAIRGQDEIKYSSHREGEEIGRHVVRFSMPGEDVEIIHQAHKRSIYALGALNVAGWLASQGPGMYDLRNFLESR